MLLGEIPNDKAFVNFQFGIDSQLRDRFFPGPDSILHAKENITQDEIRITFCILAETGTKEQFANLALSIVSSVCSNWDLVVIGSNEEAFETISTVLFEYEIHSARLNIVRCEEPFSSIVESINALLQCLSGHYLAILRAGDMVSPLFSYQVAKIYKRGFFPFYTYYVASPKNGAWNCEKSSFQYDRFCEYDEPRHHVIFERDAVLSAGGFNLACGTACIYELCLRLSENALVGEIPEVILFDSCENLRHYEYRDYKKALEFHYDRLNKQVYIEQGKHPQICSIMFPLAVEPLVSIIVTSKDKMSMLGDLLDSIVEKTNYQNYEIVIVENGSIENNLKKYDALVDKYNKLRVVHYHGSFNYSRLINFGRDFAKGEYLLFLNNDMKVINKDWLLNMMSYACQEEVGVVSAVLLYPDNTIQHAGAMTDDKGNVLHFLRDLTFDGETKKKLPFDCASVTGACQLVKASRFDQVGGYDEKYRIAYSDIDFCYKMTMRGYRTVCSSGACLYHYEGKTRASDLLPEERLRFEKEKRRFLSKFSDYISQCEPLRF